MTSVSAVVLVLQCVCLLQCTVVQGQPKTLTLDGTCPPWMKSTNRSTEPCECFANLTHETDQNKFPRCDNKGVLLVRACYCVGYHPQLNKSVIGNCLYSCTLKFDYKVSQEKPNKTCDKYNREGVLCGQCKPGYGLPLYSYQLNCTLCQNSTVALLKYVAATYLPLTAFYLVVIIFRISATSELLSGYILTSQMLTTPSQLRYMTNLGIRDPEGTLAIKVAIGLAAIWNLDFFKSLYPPFCYDSGKKGGTAGPLFMASLDYLVALYPLGLILLTFLAVRVHNRCPALARLCKPLHRVLISVRRGWEIRRSLVDAFATFLLLSYIKVLNASFDILLPTSLSDLETGQPLSRWYLYYEPSLMLFRGRHIKYALLALVMGVVFNVVPLLLLLLYPCRCFQALLNWTRPLIAPRLLAQPLHTFMDAFQGRYRTSTTTTATAGGGGGEGGRGWDCRYFAGIFLLARVANLVVYSVTLSRYYYPFGCMLFLALAGLINAVKPYKSSRQNTIDVCMFLVFAFGYASATAYALNADKTYSTLLTVFIGLSIAASFLYVGVLLLYKLVLRRLPRLWAWLRRRCCCWKGRGCRACREDQERLCDVDEELYESVRERSPLLYAATTPYSY